MHEKFFEDGELRDKYLIHRNDGKSIGIETITVSFPIEDIEKLDNEKTSIKKQDLPDHSKIEVGVPPKKRTRSCSNLFSELDGTKVA
ncbi:hypothetical protein [Leptospira sp. id769339]|uniref:hypothetical protein n=1 Tax=Leptospira sp. id769339 TaxID=2864221 RepID=UPI00214BACA3|nr:hypothetical protein [Leptospira sp. id769339]MCR1795779.1 hypothetical protein [Leptospira sp. id769339]